MAYDPENNPYIPGDPASYDLKWVVDRLNEHAFAEESAAEAKASAEAAAASAQEASGYADDAEGYRDAASGYADDASGYANDASGYADEAADYAAHIADPVSGLVTSWLDDNITQPTTPAIDASLSVGGAAADAAATGDAIDRVKYEIDTELNGFSEEVQTVIHTLLTETTPLDTYGNALNNAYLWIMKNAPIRKGCVGLVRILLTNVSGASYRFCKLRKNSATSYTILEDITANTSAVVRVDEYPVYAKDEDIYIGLYSTNGALVFKPSTDPVDDWDRALYQDFIDGSGTATVTAGTSGLNMSYALTLTQRKIPELPFPYIVDWNGHGDFLTIQDAIDNTSDGDTIFITPGIYFETVKMWGKNRHLVGLDKNSTIIASTNRYYNNEPLQANIGSISNLTLIGGYGLTPNGEQASTSYALHIEYANASPFEFAIDNCYLLSNVAPAVGIGVRYNQTIRITNSKLETKAAQMWSSVYSEFFNIGGAFVHNDASGSNLGNDGRLEISNCELKGKVSGITLQSQDNNNELTIRFVNNLLWSTDNGKTNAVTLRTPATPGHLAGSDVVLDAMSFGNNITSLNA